MGIQTINNVGYGLSEALPTIFNAPVVSRRAPTTRDKAPIGQIWIFFTSNEAYILTSIVNNAANWVLLEGSGGTGVFSSVISATTVTAGTGITSTTGNIVATAGAVTAGTTMTAGTGITATLGNITATNGNVVLSTAATYVQLPGAVRILTGAGVPANGLANVVGTLYINTTAATDSTRLYIATAASTWTSFTAAA